jgi:hypothetical protein
MEVYRRGLDSNRISELIEIVIGRCEEILVGALVDFRVQT